MYAPATSGMGNIFTAALRRVMYARLDSPTRETVETTIRNLAGLENWYNQARRALDGAQRRNGSTDDVLQLQELLNGFRDRLVRFDDAVRAAIETARADNQQVTTRDNAPAGLGLMPVVVVLSGAQIVSVYCATTQFGLPVQQVIDDAYSLQSIRAQAEAFVAQRARIFSDGGAIRDQGAAPVGGGQPLIGTTFPLPILLGVGVVAFLLLRRRA